MLSPKDFYTGCLSIAALLLALIAVPVLLIFFKFSLLAAIPIGLIIGVLVSVGILGKLIRIIFSKKR
mgnify:CR=1 FL=1